MTIKENALASKARCKWCKGRCHVGLHGPGGCAPGPEAARLTERGAQPCDGRLEPLEQAEARLAVRTARRARMDAEKVAQGAGAVPAVEKFRGLMGTNLTMDGRA